MNSENIMRILVVGRIYEEDQIFNLILKTVQEFMQLIEIIFYFMDERTCIKIQTVVPLGKFQKFNVLTHAEILDYVVTIGGDGTILYAAKQFVFSQPPSFLSFQKGTLGFMCKFSISQLSEVISSVVKLKTAKNEENKIFDKSSAMRIQGIVQINKQKHIKCCLNQIAIVRNSSSRIILQLYINDQFITETSGDGLLISTPTGSTAYALSAGGPVLESSVNSILIVPVAPNSLSFRPLCLSPDSVIKVKMSNKSRANGILSFDGQTHYQFTKQNIVEVKKANNSITFFQPKQNQAKLPTWMNRLTYFLGWNETFKSPTCENIQFTKRLKNKATSNFTKFSSSIQ